MGLFVGDVQVAANRDAIMPATPQGLNKIKLHPISLSFRDGLEKAFRDGYLINSLRTVRFSLMAGIVLYSLFGILDAILVPSMRTSLWIVRFAVVCPFLLGVILFTYFPVFKKYFQFSVAAAMVLSGGGIIYMTAILPPPVNQTYYAGLILVLIWGYTFTRIRFVWASSAGLLLVVLYEIVAVQVIESPFAMLMNNSFFFISSNLVGMFACYFIELYTRRDFFLAVRLEKEQEKVKQVNRRLEKIVAKRTAQLLEKNRELSDEIEERKKVEKGRAELESKFQEAQKMEAIGRLAGGIAHDFNNLLMGIQGNISLMMLKTKPTDIHFEKLKNTEQYVLRGSELTRQLLGFARRGKYNVHTTNINSLIDESTKLFGRTNKEVSIHLVLASHLWVVNIDRGQIEQVLLNLLMNAWQAMPGGGDLVIKTENAVVDEGGVKGRDIRPGKFVRVSVRDNGIGMAPNTMQKIFDPFFTTKEMGRGTGMGLASAYGIIQNHDGFFEVDSEVGKGSTISFLLPASSGVVSNVEKMDACDVLLKGTETILLVDDETVIAEVASEMLENLGYDVRLATNGQDALEIYAVEGEKVDLVILDLIMPGMSGHKAFDMLRQMNPHVRVLLSSGFSLSGEASDLMARGGGGFIQKPYNIGELSKKVREVLS